MELKQLVSLLRTGLMCLNRTFYGIETNSSNRHWQEKMSLNRTFYGIETEWLLWWNCVSFVLIVPFMELKLYWCAVYLRGLGRLNRTFYGIETVKAVEHILHRLGLNRTFYGIETKFIQKREFVFTRLNRKRPIVAYQL